MTSLFPKSLRKQQRSKLQNVTLRGFGGGLNAVDDDISMQPRYLKQLKNFYRTSSGSQKLRFGNSWFADLANIIDFELREDGTFELCEDGSFELRDSPMILSVNAQILDVSYFNGRIVAVTTNGYIATVDALGGIELIWTPAIAAALPGAPSFWSSGLSLVTFVSFKNELEIHNGIDKPLSISNAFVVTYLQDLGTGSNVNVPIGKYGCVAANYHCVAGIPNSPTEIIVSSKGTSGTFPLDPAPNDAISIDVGAYAPEGASEIIGIAGFRSYLIVFFNGISLQIKLGVYNSDGDHTPEFPDDFPTFGLIGSRCICKIGTNIMFAGIQGLTNAQRSITVPGQLDSGTISSVIEPLYQGAIGSLTDTQRKINAFTVYDPLSHTLMLFYPDGKTFTYAVNDKLNYKAWSEYEGMDWTCGCTTALGRVFLAKGSKIFQYGNDTYGDRYHADRMNDRDVTWANSTVFPQGVIAWDRNDLKSFLCNVSHTSRAAGLMSVDREANPSFWTEYKGQAIEFDFETPWFDGKDPMKVKKLAFVSIASKGTAEFTLDAYVDNLYKDEDGVEIYDPAISMDFIGNDAPGYGSELEDGPFGTGRRSRDPRLFEFPVKFKTVKFRARGAARKMLELINFSYLFSRGSYFR